MSRHRHRQAPPEEPVTATTQTLHYRPAQLGPATASTTQATNVSDASNATAEFHGQGRITGLAIYSFGKFVLRGFEYVDQAATLRRIRVIFPHGDDSRVPRLDKVYEDVLELSRDLYNEYFRKHALLAIWKQIASAQTLHLVKALNKWPRAEIDLFIMDLMCCLGQKWTNLDPGPGSPKSMYTDLGDAYFATTFYAHPLLPFVQFIAELAGSVPLSASGILSSGFLDLLLNLYLQSFLITSKSNPRTAARRCCALFDACNTALKHIILSARRQPALRDKMLETLRAHPLDKLWPRKATMPLSSCIRRQFLDRTEMWRTLGRALVVRRLDGIANMISASHEGRGTYGSKSVMPLDFPSDELVNTTTDIFDEFIDLIEFSSTQTYGECVARYTIEILNRYFTGISGSLNPQMAQIEVVQTMRDWILTKCWDPSTLEDRPLWSLDRPVTSSRIPLTSHIIHNLQLDHQLKNPSLHIYDKSTFYFSSVFTVALDTYTHELFGALSSSTHVSSLSPHPPPKPRGRLIYDARTQYPDPGHFSPDPFCASSPNHGSLVQSWFKPVALYEPFRATTPKALYEPETREVRISMPFDCVHTGHLSPELGTALVGGQAGSAPEIS